MKYSWRVKCIIVDTDQVLIFKFNRLVEAIKFGKFLCSHGDAAFVEPN